MEPKADDESVPERSNQWQMNHAEKPTDRPEEQMSRQPGSTDPKKTFTSSNEKQENSKLVCRIRGKIKECPVEIVKHEVHTQNVASYELVWNGSTSQLLQILQWFQDEVKPQDSKASLGFPHSLSAQRRAEIHNMAGRFDLWTASRGVRYMRSIYVYTSKSESKRKTNYGRKVKDEAIKILRWIKDHYGNGPVDSPYSTGEVCEMLNSNKMTEDFKEMHDAYKARQSGVEHADRRERYERSETRERKSDHFPSVFQDMKWINPEERTMGYFFFNKLVPDEKINYEFSDLGVTKVMTFDELVPLEDLQEFLITNDEWFSNSLYVSEYFPKSVSVTMVCPPHYATREPVDRKLLECPQHCHDYTIVSDVTGELQDVECGCQETRRINVINPRSSDKIGAKLMIGRYESYIRIVIGSASFDQVSWEEIGQFGWYCDLAIDPTRRSVTQNFSMVGSFGRTLMTFLHSLHPNLVDFLKGAIFDNLSPTVQLVSSVPGKFQLSDCRQSHGLMKLALFLSGIPWPEDCRPTILYQTPVCSYERRIISFLHLLNSMFDTKTFTMDVQTGSKPWDWLFAKLDKADMKILFPCVSSPSQGKKKFHLSKGLRYVVHEDSQMQIRLYMADNTDPVNGKIIWNSRVVSRFCDIKDKNSDKGFHRYGWLLVGSYGLSIDGWGEVVGDRFLHCKSFELGVIHRPHFINDPIKGGGYFIAPEFSNITLPFRERFVKPYPVSMYPASLLKEPERKSAEEESQIYMLIGRLEMQRSGRSKQLLIRLINEPTNEEEVIFFRDQELFNKPPEICQRTGIILLTESVARHYPGSTRGLASLLTHGHGTLLSFLSVRKRGSLKCVWILDARQTRGERPAVDSQRVSILKKQEVSMTTGCYGNVAAVATPASVAEDSVSDTVSECKENYEREKRIPRKKVCGMQVIGLDVDPDTLTGTSTAPKLVRPERRDVYVAKLLYNLYGVNANDRATQHGRTSIRYRKAILSAAKKRILIT
ncbi:uncharacterized protein [Ptychodera flava]|uniref:uncharacterized protein isoform X2 n=1 Tax=Ptychodera flava TaxID=63121 RepID=UPI00396A39E4